MWWKTHVSAGLVGGVYYLTHYAGTAPYFPATDLSIPTFLGVTALTAVAVDIDSKNSKIGRLIYPVAAITEGTIEHRGPLHSPFMPMGLYIFLFWLAPLFFVASNMGGISHWGPLLALPILIGYIAGHLLPDLLNPAGLSLWPFKGRIAIPLITPLGIFDKGLCLVLDVWLLIFAVHVWVGIAIPAPIAAFF